MSDRWIVTYFRPDKGWERVASGRSRLRAAIVLLLCSLARPGEKHNVRWYGDNTDAVNTKFYGRVTKNL